MGTILIIGILCLFTIFFFAYKSAGKNNRNSNLKTISVLSDAQKDFLEDAEKRIVCKGTEIYIRNHHLYSGIANTEKVILTFNEKIPQIKIYENDLLIKTFKIEPLNSNPDLIHQIFDCEIRVNANFSVQIEGAIYKDMEHLLYKKDISPEYVRLQPFHLSHRKENDERLIGRGMVARGLHYTGYRDGGGVRLVCICDYCQESFSVDFYHAGFSDSQYFYSTHSKETLMIRFDYMPKMPFHYQKDIDENLVAVLEAKLPKTEDGSFKYYNPFCCPHCLKPFNDYQKYKEDRPNDIYAHFYLNKSTFINLTGF